MPESFHASPEGYAFLLRLWFFEWRPVEQAQTQIDGRGIESIDRVRQIEAHVGIEVKIARTTNQNRRKICPNSPIPTLVGIRQGWAAHFVSQSDPKSLCALAARVTSMSRNDSR